MSGKAIGWAFDQHGLSKPQKLLLLAIADHAWHDGTNAHPGIPLLAEKTDDSERNVKRLLKDLQATGHIIRDTPGGGRGRKTTWRLPIEKGDILATVSRHATQSDHDEPEHETVTSPATNGDNQRDETVTTSAANGDIRRDIEPIEPSSGTVTEPSAQSADLEPAVSRGTPAHTDPAKIAMVAAFGEVDPDNPDDTWPLRMRLINKARATSGANAPAEIERRAALMLAQWGPGALTVPSLLKHWGRFGAAVGQLTRDDADRFVEANQRARRQAEIAAAFDSTPYPAPQAANQENR